MSEAPESLLISLSHAVAYAEDPALAGVTDDEAEDTVRYVRADVADKLRQERDAALEREQKAMERVRQLEQIDATEKHREEQWQKQREGREVAKANFATLKARAENETRG